MDNLDLKLIGYEKSVITIENYDQYWCNVRLEFKNSYFNYLNESDILQKTEVKRIYDMLTKCLSNQLEKDTILYFDEPDIEFMFFKDKVDKEHHIELRLFMMYDNVGYTSDYFSVRLYNKEINLLRDYLYELVRGYHE